VCWYEDLGRHLPWVFQRAEGKNQGLNMGRFHGMLALELGSLPRPQLARLS
jgi:hypothetical protein